MMQPIEFGALAFSSIFAMVNPVSAAPLFVDLTKRHADKRKRTAIRASLTAGLAMALFAAAGGAIFSFFGITVPAFQIVGGLIFTLSSIRELQGIAADEAEIDHDAADPSVVPIGIPLLAGAGSLSTVMVLSGQARDRLHQAALGGAIVLNTVISLIVLLMAPLIVARISQSGQNIMSKLMALLTAVIGVQFIINGGTAVITDVIRSIR